MRATSNSGGVGQFARANWRRVGAFWLAGLMVAALLSGRLSAADTNLISTGPAARLGKNFQEARARFASDSVNLTNAWQLGRASFELAELATNNVTKADIAEQGIAACRQALTHDPKSVPAHYYLGMTIGQYADTKRNMAALKMVKEMEREFLTTRELDEHFDFAGADRNLGLLYHQSPSIISIGSRTKARQHLQRAVELAPDFPENRLNLIETLLKWDDRNDALRELKTMEKLWPDAQKKFTGPNWAAAWPDWEKRRARLHASLRY